MNILVTGGAGFIGSHIADAYISAGHNVSIIDNFSTGVRANVHPDVKVYEADICDRESVERIFREGSFDVLSHLSAQLDVRVSVRDPQFDAQQNIIGSLNLFQAALQTGVRRIVFASSGGTVYGEQQVFPADETHPTDPISPYGVAKLAIEKYLNYYRHEHGIEHVVFRYTNVFGPRQNPHGEAGVVAIFCEKMLKGDPPVIYGDGNQTRDYVYVGDVVRANMMALDYMEQHGSSTFNICTNTETTVNDLFGTLNMMFDDVFEEQHAEGRKGEQIRSVCSYEKARTELGWEPLTGVAKGLEKTMAFFRGDEVSVG